MSSRRKPLAARAINRRSFLRGSLVAAAGSGALLLIGCGDSKSSSTSTAVPASPTARPQPSPSPGAAAPRTAWSRVDAAGAPPPRRDHSLTFNTDDGMIYVFGGRVGDTSNNELWTLDPRTSAWRQLPSPGAIPEPRFGDDALYDAANKRLVIALGQGNGRTFFNDVWAFDASGWKQLSSAGDGPEIRYGAGSAHDVAANRLVISHGFTDQGRYDDTWTFDLRAGAWSKIGTSGDVPIKRCLTRCAWSPSSQSLLLFGGQTDSNPFLGDFWRLDTTGGKWQEQKPSPLPGARNLYGASLDAAGNRWYISSGNTPDGPTAETWRYDLASNVWSMLDPSSPPPARYSADAAIAGGKLYVFGGHDGKTELNDTWALPLVEIMA